MNNTMTNAVMTATFSSFPRRPDANTRPRYRGGLTKAVEGSRSTWSTTGLDPIQDSRESFDAFQAQFDNFHASVESEIARAISESTKSHNGAW